MVKYAQAVKALWRDRCTVQVLRNTKRIPDGKTTQSYITLFSDEPCRLSFKFVTITEEADHAARTVQSTVLFLDRAKEIPPGSKITVTHEGVTSEYVRSGAPAVYSVHQEIPLKLKGEWA